jgi:uridine kinase
MIWDKYQNEFRSTLIAHGQKLVIAISGRSGSGKSSVAYHLCKKFKEEGLPAKHLWADNFYRDNYQGLDPATRTERRRQRGYSEIGPIEYDWLAIGNILAAFSNNNKCVMPCIDILTQDIDWLETDFSRHKILVIDGLYAIHKEMKADFRFFLEGETSPDKDYRDNESDSEDRRRILQEEKVAIQKIKEDQINANDLIVLSYEIKSYRLESGIA